MRPSPIRAENHRIAKPSAASKIATAATAMAITITSSSSWRRMPWSMIWRSSNGLTTVMSASIPVIRRNTARYQR